MGLNVLHGLHLLAEGPAGGLEGHQLVVLAGETGQVILQLLHADGGKEGEGVRSSSRKTSITAEAVVPKSMKSRNFFKDEAVGSALFLGMCGGCCAYFERELHHGQHVDTGRLPVSGDNFSDLLRLQTAHCVELVSGEAHFGSKDLSERCTQSRKTAKPF